MSGLPEPFPKGVLQRPPWLAQTGLLTPVAALFGYGTFRDDAWRAQILGADYPAEPARLPGYRRVKLAHSGYLSIERTQDAWVDGVLVTLDAIGWCVADAWEEVPTYTRIPVSVITIRGPVDAEVYVAAGTIGGPVPDEWLATLESYEVDEAIRQFARRRDTLRGDRDA